MLRTNLKALRSFVINEMLVRLSSANVAVHYKSYCVVSRTHAGCVEISARIARHENKDSCYQWLRPFNLTGALVVWWTIY
ncbi:hypothetical protein M378DRAFT_466177 [Amanita muscaria Koide BX008]|uniref:Uncharacterized protein n=1 Tax=Amanita muscaria (strain Koide BX008) TaxID=946122 RepID=A0A0C2S1N5_AMAMK|nr:hypothetical protein M378DRAFT_466177 [Amanita muscaria Koide BX008]